jgi:hypothetical protein
VATTDDFVTACHEASRGLRRVPSELRREIAQQSRDLVAAPLAVKVAGAAVGPWGPLLAAGTKARSAADPTIVVGGLRPKLSGGAGPRQIVFGVEFGAGKRLSVVPSRPGQRGHRRYTTKQFRSRQQPFVFDTIGANIPWVLDTFADLTMTTLEKGVNRG